ncbi:MAG: hypothetical protein WA364_21090 [Candidatus Nitrosopolaris sp.]
MVAGCFFFTWLNGHLVPEQVPGGIATGTFFIVAVVAGIGLFVKERRVSRVKIA